MCLVGLFSTVHNNKKNRKKRSFHQMGRFLKKVKNQIRTNESI